MADRRHRARTVAATVAATCVGLTGAALMLGAEPPAAASESARTARPTREARAPHVALDAAIAARARVEAEEALKQQAIRNYLAAMAEYYRPKTGVNWDGIAQCETGGNWSMRGASFSGGLGFYNGTWSAFGGRQFAPNAGMASREQQIVVAERVYARYGLSGWGCRAYG